jgi:LysM repeat protein
MKKRILWIIPAVLLGIAVLLLALFFFMRGRALNSRPLVLIQNPADSEQVEVGRGLIVQASARARQGVSMIELWVDNQLVTTREASKGELTPTLVLSAAWTPSEGGNHNLIVRAVTRDRVEGQSSIQVQAVGVGGTGLSTHVVQPGDTLASIAYEYGISREELGALNEDALGGAGGAGLQVGDELIVPEPGAGSAGISDETAGESAGDAESPEPAASAPGSLESFGLILPAFHFNIPGETVELTAEVLTLETRAAYESLHCYVSLGGSSPRWLPDEDANQATDESFAATDFGHTWGIASQLAGERAVRISWDETQPIPLDINCVGLTGGGTDSVKLGRVQASAGPETWGILQHASSTGGEGDFRITWLIDYPEKGPDASILPPWNVRLSPEQHLLAWDYTPNVDGHPVVDGFAIIMNDTLQWLETGSIRQAHLPEQWFAIPCGDEYSFQVVAFNGGYPDGNYSLPSNTASITGGDPGSGGCNRSVVLTFETLTTGDLPGNPDPVYGSFFANDQTLPIDGRPVEGDNFHNSFGLDQNSEYSISGFTSFWGVRRLNWWWRSPQATRT